MNDVEKIAHSINDYNIKDISKALKIKTRNDMIKAIKWTLKKYKAPFEFVDLQHKGTNIIGIKCCYVNNDFKKEFVLKRVTTKVGDWIVYRAEIHSQSYVIVPHSYKPLLTTKELEIAPWLFDNIVLVWNHIIKLINNYIQYDNIKYKKSLLYFLCLCKFSNHQGFRSLPHDIVRLIGYFILDF